ncbi:MAG: hypothetical protein COZ06_03595 [Armatimonadetes bacterium CG_4_10_14_3_um_filter_66_18]|nr:MAG: hypothetical protein COZ06_03595 [Armatimonadetes bacterium CG_4_10_14_3_um_filter_66_18]
MVPKCFRPGSGGLRFVDAAIQGAAIVATYNIAHYRLTDLPPHGWTAMTPNEFATRYPLGEVR